MPADSAIILADAHISSRQDDPASTALQRFLVQVPRLGNHLVINGDLFEFWFEYRSVIPRHVFPVLGALWDVTRAGVRVTIIGGNHDRWGGRFWREQLGAAFHPRSAELDLAGWHAFVGHGDGVMEPTLLSKALHGIIGHPMTAATFRILHPDLGFWLVRKSARILSRRRDDQQEMRRAAAAQATTARELLERRTDLHLAVYGHTHWAMLEEIAPKRWYLNPGAWMNECAYAVVTPDGPELRKF